MSSIGCADSDPVVKSLTVAVQDGLTARAGGGQSANPLDGNFTGHRFTTVASANDSATLPAATYGAFKILANAAASNSMNVFPGKGDAINTLGANNAFALGAGKTALFLCMGAGQWHSILTT